MSYKISQCGKNYNAFIHSYMNFGDDRKTSEIIFGRIRVLKFRFITCDSIFGAELLKYVKHLKSN